MSGEPANLVGASPTELRDGDDPVARFRLEATAVSAIVSECTPAGLTAHLADMAARLGAIRIAVSDDVPAGFDDLAAALRARGAAVAAYADVAGDRTQLAALDATITGCAAAVAATGTVVVGSAAGRAAALIAPIHICVVERGRIVAGLRELMAMRGAVPGSLIALQTGPSRTADIEKVIVLGVHGPRVSEIVVVG